MSCGVPDSAIMTLAATTDDKIRTEPTERSIPAVMMTNVMPTVSTTSWDESMMMSLKFRALKNLVPPQQREDHHDDEQDEQRERLARSARGIAGGPAAPR